YHHAAQGRAHQLRALLSLLAALPARRALSHRASSISVDTALSIGAVPPPPARARRPRRCRSSGVLPSDAEDLRAAARGSVPAVGGDAVVGGEIDGAPRRRVLIEIDRADVVRGQPRRGRVVDPRS